MENTPKACRNEYTLQRHAHKLSVNLANKASLVLLLVILVNSFCVLFFQFYSSRIAMIEGSEKYLVQAARIGDRFQLFRHLESLKASGFFDELWLLEKGTHIVISKISQGHRYQSFQDKGWLGFNPKDFSILITSKFPISADGGESDYFLHGSFSITLMPLFIALLFTLGISILIRKNLIKVHRRWSHELSKPLSELTEKIRNFSHKESKPISLKFNDEIAEISYLTNNFNKSMKRIFEYEKKMQDNVKLRAIAHATANIAHDLRGPVNVFRSAFDENAILPSHRNAAHSALSRINTMIEAFRNSDEDQIIKPHNGFIDFEGLAAEAKIGKKVKIRVTANENQEIYADIAKLERIILNLLRNAIEAGADRIALDLVTEKMHGAIVITDNGPGIPEKLRGKIFERGATFGKEGGTGLGLAYCKAVAQGHGGDITYYREAEKSIFRVELPDAIPDLVIEANQGAVEQTVMQPVTSNPVKAVKLQALVISKDPEKQKKVAALIHGIPVTHDRSQAHCSAAIITDDFDIILANQERYVSYLRIHESQTPEEFIKENQQNIKLLPLKAKSLGFEILKV